MQAAVTSTARAYTSIAENKIQGFRTPTDLMSSHFPLLSVKNPEGRVP